MKIDNEAVKIKNAKCKGIGWQLFYPEVGGNGKTIPAIIKKYCANCEAREECLAAGFREEHKSGIWGGLTPNQRKILRNKFPGRTCLCGTGEPCYVHT